MQHQEFLFGGEHQEQTLANPDQEAPESSYLFPRSLPGWGVRRRFL